MEEYFLLCVYRLARGGIGGLCDSSQALILLHPVPTSTYGSMYVSRI